MLPGAHAAWRMKLYFCQRSCLVSGRSLLHLRRSPAMATHLKSALTAFLWARVNGSERVSAQSECQTAAIASRLCMHGRHLTHAASSPRNQVKPGAPQAAARYINVARLAPCDAHHPQTCRPGDPLRSRRAQQGIPNLIPSQCKESVPALAFLLSLHGHLLGSGVGPHPPL